MSSLNRTAEAVEKMKAAVFFVVAATLSKVDLAAVAEWYGSENMTPWRGHEANGLRLRSFVGAWDGSAFVGQYEFDKGSGWLDGDSDGVYEFSLLPGVAALGEEDTHKLLAAEPPPLEGGTPGGLGGTRGARAPRRDLGGGGASKARGKNTPPAPPQAGGSITAETAVPHSSEGVTETESAASAVAVVASAAEEGNSDVVDIST